MVVALLPLLRWVFLLFPGESKCEGLRNWGLLSRKARLEVKWTEERLDSVGEGGTVIIDAPSSVWRGKLGTSKEPRGLAGLSGERMPEAVGERF
jgi:hypothetical protein